ncbi:MAG: PEP-CTERM sorting domain-containing protein [Okeania sp. SIO2C9]|uniref:PEP-CTERM sorting domain-containing protein n=1 Tax=Okeania sp. SIO2C9 TaxID=2607791 RepID=UPI0013BF8D0D|nr:PEP-CTERM sorting domain-containing protein [Okeania sp. SIO2C9]NEQ71619.1 PEP-CTERM sorting domain-containing protein [Okeania sp. SIO2C9]NEQ71620.1 PEP-CTERM sorting domain-containing protein [Okeania sp. SIO2C9]
MKNQIVASIAAIPFLIAGANAANAAVIQFDDETISGGTISYDGEGGSLVGTDFLLDMVMGIDTNANDGAELVCDSCVLNFETGANISEDGFYTFGSGGSVSITGTVRDDLGEIIADGELVSGSFTGDISVGANDFSAAFLGLGVNEVNSDLSSFFGIETTDFIFAQTVIAMEDVEVENNGGFSGVVTNVDFDSKAQKVPEPTVLFGLGVVVAGLTVSRRQKISSTQE